MTPLRSHSQRAALPQYRLRPPPDPLDRRGALKDLSQVGGWKDVGTIILRCVGEDMDAMREALANRRAFGGDYQGKERGGGGRHSA